MPEARDLLRGLCAHFGIAEGYHDVWGTWRAVPDESLAKLIAEFGVDTGSPEAIAAAARALDKPSRAALLPPVLCIAPDDAQWSMQIDPATPVPLTWTLDVEEGNRHQGTIDAGASALTPGIALPAGYHRLALQRDGTALGHSLVIVAPAQCWRPEMLDDGARLWGPTLQLYALRSARNWGIGDFSDLTRAIEVFAARGASLVGLNPLHALFPHNPAHASPYSPSSRLWLNALYLDIEAIEDYAESQAARAHVAHADFRARLAGLRAGEQIDTAGIGAAKLEVLELLYAHFRAHHLRASDRRGLAFRAFQSTHGENLRKHALYEAIQAHCHRADPTVWGWPCWPEDLRDPAAPAVRRFEREHGERVEFFEYLQWQAELQLGRAVERCEALGMAIGLYLDLAVSVDRAGSDAWRWQSIFATSASVGAPPDEFNPNGQNWGLPPLRPDALRAAGYQPFIRALRASMRHCGALRIDHVMGLMRLYWIPQAATAAAGSYVHYPLDELVAIVALESHRNRCVVIGEDLGTVADEMRAALERARILSYRLLYFEREHDGAFKQPAQYPADALVAISTHDLPTLAGWWEGRDLQVRQALSLFPDDALRNRQLLERSQDRTRLLIALEHAGLLPDGISADALPPALDAGLAEAVHAYAARTPSVLMVVQAEDLLRLPEQANLPGTVDEHPNWRRRLPLALEDLVLAPGTAGLLAQLRALRPQPEPALPAETPAARIPRATYRLQFNSGFTFDDAVAIVPYLAQLGVSHVYASPVLRARAGSTHGYDIVDHSSINPELGGEAGFARLRAALRERGMGLILDIVPNHMGVLGSDNAWWMSVLENGPASEYAGHFDIDWQPVNPHLAGKVLVPVLGAHYGEILQRGELKLVLEATRGSFAVRYFEHRFPIDPRTAATLLRRAATQPASGLDDLLRAELASLADAFGHLPPRDAADAAARAERARDRLVHLRRLAQLLRSQPAVSAALEAIVAGINADPAGPLHKLLEAQAWRLAYWRVASDEINYRRFFDINDLAALRMDDPAVFEATHAYTLDLVADGAIDGLRIDHPDGLLDPAAYFERLQAGVAQRRGQRASSAGTGRAFYVVAEKIAASHEHVPESWAIHGTTGYRFGALANGLFVDTAARTRIDRIWRAFTGETASYEDMAYEGKKVIMRSALASELTVLANALLRVAHADHRTRDYTFLTLRRALAEVAACMPVYRTYLVDAPSTQDRRYIDWAVSQAMRRSRAADTSIFEFVRRALLAQPQPGSSGALSASMRAFARQFQQFTAPVTAKGEEDTAFYRFNRLASLNEVGGEPDTFGITVRAFHGASGDRAARWPHTLLATSTHDNKRAEDVRLRISVLSERPAAWRLLLRRWRTLNAAHRSRIDDAAAPSRNDEYLLYQTLLGTFSVPEGDDAALAAYRGRIEAYVVKAAREAKQHTSWISPDLAYEAALTKFVHGLLERLHPNPFVSELREQCRAIEWFGALNALSLALLKFTSPGVPDTYQGTELIDLSLVDPDNRRPVDFAARAALLDSFAAQQPQALAAALAKSAADGRAKLYAIWRLLTLRRAEAELLRDGEYLPLAASGAKKQHVVAYARRVPGATLIVITSRLHAQLLGEPGALPLGEAVWGDTAVSPADLPENALLEDALTGSPVRVRNGSIQLSDAFCGFPGAVLLFRRH